MRKFIVKQFFVDLPFLRLFKKKANLNTSETNVLVYFYMKNQGLAEYLVLKDTQYFQPLTDISVLQLPARLHIDILYKMGKVYL